MPEARERLESSSIRAVKPRAGNQRTEILPFIDRRGWKLVHTFEDVMSGQKGEKERPGFAAMLQAAHQRKFDILVFWALDRLTREGTRATLNYLSAT